ARLQEVAGVHRLCCVKLGGNLAQLIVPNDANEMRFCAQPGCGHRLIRSFPTGSHVKVGTDQRLAKYRHATRAQSHSNCEAAHDSNDWLAHDSFTSTTHRNPTVLRRSCPGHIKRYFAPKLHGLGPPSAYHTDFSA